MKDRPLPAVVRCRERRQDVAPVEGLVYEQPQRYLGVGALSSVLTGKEELWVIALGSIGRLRSTIC